MHCGRELECDNVGIAMPGVSTPRVGLVRFASHFRQLVTKMAPDAVVAFMHSMYAPAAISLLATRYPLIASEHIDAAHYAGRPVQAAAARIARELATAITVPSVQVQYEMPSHLRAKTTVLSNPIDLSAFASTRPAPSEPPYTILAAGRFTEQKNHLELIEAFSRIAERFPDWTLRIVGDGELRGQLEHRIAGLGLPGRVQLLRHLKQHAGRIRGGLLRRHAVAL